MSYRSNVAIALLKKDFRQLLQNADEAMLDFIDEMNRRTIKGINGENVVQIYIRSIKWDPYHDKEIIHLMDFISDGDFPYAFIREGEDEEDVEQHDRRIGNQKESLHWRDCPSYRGRIFFP